MRKRNGLGTINLKNPHNNMFQSQIVSITPDGEFDVTLSNGSSAHLFANMVSFADGIVGSANSRSNPPPYGVGSTVGYEITGERNGVQKLKIDAKPKPGTVFAQRAQPVVALRPNPTMPVIAAAVAPGAPILPKTYSSEGARVGMGVNGAIEVLIHNAKAVGEPIDLPTLQHNVEQVALCLITAARRLEGGQVTLAGEDVPF